MSALETTAVLLLCVAFSFLFSGMETGVLALNRVRVRQLMRSGDARARVLHGFMENPEDFLWTILVGNTVVNCIIFSLMSIQLRDWVGGRMLWWSVAFVAAVFVFYILCELLPKTLFQRYPNRLSLALARPFRLIHRLLAPLVAVVAWFSRGVLRLTGGKAFTGRLFGSREELRFVMQEAAPNLTSEEKAMINRVLDLQTLRVRHAAIPLHQATTVAPSTPMSQVLALCRQRELSRLPVLDAESHRVAGIIDLERVLYLPDLELGKEARNYMEPPFFLPEELRLEEALRRMQHAGWRLAVVLGPNQVEVGVIGLRDILKVIFGEVTL
jgi:CBS domain containing-hemolysin-like protein